MIPGFHWQTNINLKRKSKSVKEKKFSKIVIEHIESLPAEPKLHIWFENDGRSGIWKAIPITHFDHEKNTFEFDATDLPHDEYRYHLAGKDDHKNPFSFSLCADNEETYLAETFLGDDSIVYPTHKIGLNNFGKKSSVTTPAGEKTLYTHGKLNKLSTQTDPVIAVTDETGNTTHVAAVTTVGCDESGKKIGVRDANGNTELFIRDEASQVLKHTAGDGTPYYTKVLDVFGNDIQVISASGNIWNKVFNRKNKITQVIQPSGDTWGYKRNEHDFVITITPPANAVTGIIAYAQGLYGDMCGQFSPMGQKRLYSHDRHHGILSEQVYDVGATTPTYATSFVRDFSSRVLTRTDGSNSTYQYSFYPTGVPYQELHPRAAGALCALFSFEVG